MSKTERTFCYFAYGSNMLTERLKVRCPRAKAIGCAIADGQVIEFSKRSKDNSGKATLSGKTGARTVGVLFEIPKNERDDLDDAEGVSGGGYERCNEFVVSLVDGDGTMTATTYLATKTESGLKPYDWYLALVIAGASEHDLGEDCLASLRRVNSKRDPRASRCTRIEAIEVLKKAGFPDYGKLLRQN